MRNAAGKICGFEMADHANTRVCAAVSALAINTANAVEKFTGAAITVDYDEKGGYLKFELPEIKSGETCEKADLLLETLALGVCSIAEQYKGQIKIKNITVKS
jgi:uncharacterized protein YsxB (DUF464 family)